MATRLSVDNFTVVATQSIDTLNHQNVPFAQTTKKTPVLRTPEVLSTRFVSIDQIRLDRKLLQRIQLAIQVLIC